LAAGLPCLVSRAVAISEEIAQASAGIVIGTGSEDIAVAIEKLLWDEVGISAMSKAARRLASSAFSIEEMGARLDALYRSILVMEPHGRMALAS
jgi:glycosyltransferase involved in cell wall biosynthesis